MKYHPDKNPGDKKAEENFKLVSEAYDILKDPQKRQMFDQFGMAGAHAQGPGGPHPFGGFGGFHGETRTSRDDSIHDVFHEFFGDVFGGSQRRKGPFRPKGTDLRYTLSITMEEAALGCQKMINFVRQRNGKEDSARLSISVPAGVKSGQRLKLKGEGDSSPQGGATGDLFVVISIQDHPLFKRVGDDVVMDLPVSYVDAILGADVTVPTLQGKVKLKIAPGTHGGQIYRLKSKGFSSKVKTGDMLIRIIIATPKSLTNKERQLLEQLKATSSSSPLEIEYQEKLELVLKRRQ